MAVVAAARTAGIKRVRVDGRLVEIPTPFPSPSDWRDHWIYALVVDRFNNPQAPPSSPDWDAAHSSFQGGTLEGVRAQLPYLRELGVGAILLSPVQKNCQYAPDSYHGYGPQSFLEIEPRFASDPVAARRDPRVAERELAALVDEAHARGIYVILDIVLNHAGRVFDYADSAGSPSWRDRPYPVQWLDERGQPRPEWADAPANGHVDAGIWPSELRYNACFVRQGRAHKVGDFYDYRKLATTSKEVRDALIGIARYLIARYDVDGFRLDALDLLDEEFALLFPEAMRSYALSIGKRNFFTVGEVAGGDPDIVRLVGNHPQRADGLTGVDAMLDYPLFFILPHVLKGFAAPTELVQLLERRRTLHRGLVGTRGAPGDFFVTFLDNHDQHHRFYHSPPDRRHSFDDQVSLGLACLFGLPGIPCVYYGSEQGLCGTRERYDDTRPPRARYEWVRESLWGKPGAFDRGHPFYRAIRRLSGIRGDQPALRHGRTRFPTVSGAGAEFDPSAARPGVVAFSRILDGDEVLCVANTDTQRPWRGEVEVDGKRNPVGSTVPILFSNKAGSWTPCPVARKPSAPSVGRDLDTVGRTGPARVVALELQPMEVQILGRANVCAGS